MLFLRIERKYTYVMGGMSDILKRALVDTFTVTVPGFWFAKSQMERKATTLKANADTQAKGHSLSKRAKAWDGTKKFINKEGTRFPTGLLDLFFQFCYQNNIEYTVTEDLREFLPFDPNPVTLGGTIQKQGITYPFELYPFQQEAAQVMAERGNGILHAGTGSGKCMALGTKVLMFDGSIKNVEDLVVGEKLMGDDSTPRSILSTCNGIEPLYEVVPVKGESYTVNESHILCLRLTGLGNTRFSFLHKCKDSILEVSIRDYLNISKSGRHILKGYKVPVCFPPIPVKLDPYYMGLWLGDGTSDSTHITSIDEEIFSYLADLCAKHNLRLVFTHFKHTKARCCRLSTVKGTKNPLLDLLRKYGVINNKHIPFDYKINSEEVRLQVLAGLIDSDGHVRVDRKDVTFTQKSLLLATDITYLSRSLGFAAYTSTVQTKGVTYHRVRISGDIYRIPTLIHRKQCTVKRTQKKNVLVTGISVIPKGVGDYYGFTLDGNGRFLLGDFTVTHNTEVAAGLIKKLQIPKTLFLTHRNLLSSQTSKRLAKRLDQPIGVIGGGLCDIQQVTIGMVPTLSYRIETGDKAILAYLKSVQLVIGDEIHLGTADSWLSVFQNIQACNLYGLSGTPFKGSVVDDMKLLSVIGPEIYKVPTKWLIDNKYLVPPTIKVVPIRHAHIDGTYAEVYKSCVVNNTNRHKLVREVANLSTGKQTLILVTEVEHGKQLYQLMKKDGAEYINGRMNSSKIAETLERFATKELNILISTPLLDVGVDIPTIDRMILCNGAGKAITAILQRIGRSLRLSEGKVEAEIFDIADIEQQYLLEHFNDRMAIYSDENQQFRIELLDILNQFPQQNLNY